MNILGISGLNNSVSFKKREFPDLPGVCYRIAQGFDAASALVTSSGIVAAAAEERFTREKTTGALPVNAMRYCLETGGVKADDIDFLAHNFNYDSFESSYRDSDYTSRLYDEVYSREALLACIAEKLPGQGWEEKLVQVPHHLAHAASTFYVSGFDESLILISDGMGEHYSTTVAVGTGPSIKVLTQIPSIHSLGILYSVFTLYLGFVFNMDEYKVMGLAPYGNPRRYLDKMMELINLKDDGTHSISVLFRSETELQRETYSATIDVFTEMFGPAREPESEITQHHMDIAAALQTALQNALMHTLRHFKDLTGMDNLCTAGGVALNCSANGVLRRSRLFSNMFVQPASGDDGTALSAALYVRHQQDPAATAERMSVPLWGPEFSRQEITPLVEQASEFDHTLFENFGELAAEIAARLEEGQIIGWFQGRMEYGPRALGNRSILADPRPQDMRERINAIIKKRELFRPFAPAVASEYATRYFEIDEGEEELYSHMLFVTRVRREQREALPAITHVDGSARVQTVSEEQNPRFWVLIRAFEARTGMPVVLNTSFNVRGQPIVCTPQEALETFNMADLDALVMGDYLLTRK
jgi:carbamoyltransferase